MIGVDLVARLIVGAAGAFLVVVICMSAVRTFVVPRASGSFLTRVFFIVLRRIFELIAHERRSFLARDRVLAVSAPLGLVLMPGMWVIGVIIGGTGVHWAIEQHGLRDAFLVSGSSMLTLGVRFNASMPGAIVSFIQATIGLGLVALLISYLPTIYGSFSRRESAVAMLEVRAGTPPSPAEMLIRFWRIGMLENYDDELLPRWEQWFVEVEESHSSISSLVFFRSTQPERSWITAAGCVLDSTAIYLSCIEGVRSPRGAIVLRTGFVTLRRICDVFNLPYEHDPRPGDPISVTRAEFDATFDELVASGLPMKSDRDQAWRDFAGWRVNYDQPLVLLAKMIVAPDAKWSSDRSAPRITPPWTLRAARAQAARGRVI